MSSEAAERFFESRPRTVEAWYCLAIKRNVPEALLLDSGRAPSRKNHGAHTLIRALLLVDLMENRNRLQECVQRAASLLHDWIDPGLGSCCFLNDYTQTPTYPDCHKSAPSL